MAKKNLTGASSAVSVGGIKLYITKHTTKVSPKECDTTDSADYDADSDLLQPTQIYASKPLEVSVEGNYDANGNTTSVIEKVQTNTDPVSVSLTRATGSVVGSGLFTISAYEEDNPVEDTITWKATLKSYGKFTWGS